MPPWPHEEHIQPESIGENPFRVRHRLAGKFVIMYSGNHSPSNPLTTLLDAVVKLKDDPDPHLPLRRRRQRKKRSRATYIEQHQLKNALSLPYQPLAEL
jgi:colanic acid biosynthesis glycosyl transferase WcaI